MAIENILNKTREIENKYECKCYLFGKGVRQLLRGSNNINMTDFTLVVDKPIRENTQFKKVVVSSIEEYLPSLRESFEKIYVNSDGDISLKGNALISLRKGFLTYDWEDVIDDENALSDLLSFIEENFYLTSEKLFRLRYSRKMSIDVIKTMFDKFVCSGEPSTYRLLTNLYGLSILCGSYEKHTIERYITTWRVIEGHSVLKNVREEGFDLKKAIIYLIGLDIYDGICRCSYRSDSVREHLGDIIKSLYCCVLGEYNGFKLNDLLEVTKKVAEMQQMDSTEKDIFFNTYKDKIDISFKCAILFFSTRYYF